MNKRKLLSFIKASLCVVAFHMGIVNQSYAQACPCSGEGCYCDQNYQGFATTGNGAALKLTTDGNTVYNNTFTANSATAANSKGGAVYMGSSNNIISNTFTNNTSKYQGGAIFGAGSNLIKDNTFNSNTANNSNGGAIYLTDTSNTLEGNTFTGKSVGINCICVRGKIYGTSIVISFISGKSVSF